MLKKLVFATISLKLFFFSFAVAHQENIAQRIQQCLQIDLKAADLIVTKFEPLIKE